MFSLLLAIIYMAFISLGLPDSVLGSVWPIMVVDLNAEISYMGIISVIITLGTVVSSVFSGKLIQKIGTGLVTAISVGLTAVGLLGFSLANNFAVLCIMAIPYGLGAGAVDSALNDYVAVHYSSRHMSWLHAFWGVGASLGPYIMGFALKLNKGWRAGYGTLSIIQGVLTVLLFATVFLWKKRQSQEEKPRQVTLKDTFKLKGVFFAFLAFFGYCAFETTAGLWATTYLVKEFAVAEETATLFASFFYLGVTGGRFISGFISDKVGDKNMIRIGGGIVLVGLTLIALPLSTSILALIGLIIIGLGAAPVYPCLMHQTPKNFGKEYSGLVMGMQTASAYIGSSIAPLIFGILVQYVSAYLFAFYMLAFVIITIVSSEIINKIYKRNVLEPIK